MPIPAKLQGTKPYITFFLHIHKIIEKDQPIYPNPTKRLVDLSDSA